jgi:hypothetical protein
MLERSFADWFAGSCWSCCAPPGAAVVLGAAALAGAAGAEVPTGSVLSTMAGSGVMVDFVGAAGRALAFLAAAFFLARFAGLALTGGAISAGGGSGGAAGGAGGWGGGGGGGGGGAASDRGPADGVDRVWVPSRVSGSKRRSSSGIRSSGVGWSASGLRSVCRSKADQGSRSRGADHGCSRPCTSGVEIRHRCPSGDRVAATCAEMLKGRAPTLVLGLTLNKRLNLCSTSAMG